VRESKSEGPGLPISRCISCSAANPDLYEIINDWETTLIDRNLEILCRTSNFPHS